METQQDSTITGQPDWLDFFVTKHPDKRLTIAGTVHNGINQVIKGNISYYVKGNPSSFEVHQWDARWIYLREDHSINGGTLPPYSFSDGRWLRRRMKVGETQKHKTNIVTWYDPSTCAVVKTNGGPYTTTLMSHLTNFDAGGDLGKVECICLRYHWNELDYYSNEWGWFLWQHLDTKGIVDQESRFNTVSTNILQPTKACSI